MQTHSNGSPTKRNFRGQFLSTTLHPDPILAEQGLSISILERFFSKVTKTDSCMNWGGAFSKERPLAMARMRMATGGGQRCPHIPVRRVSWLIYNGEVPDGIEVLMACPHGNPACVHPNHMRLGKHCEMSKARFEATHAPLTAAQIIRVDTLLKQAQTSMDEIAAKYAPKHKTPEWMIALGFSETFADRFWRKVRKTDTCWWWEGCTGRGKKTKHGCIGTCGKHPRTVGAHVASFMLNKGPIPDGMCVCHNCPGGIDHADCVNPEHLFLGPPPINARDAAIKHRLLNKVHWNTKITAADVDIIRAMYATGKHTKADLARRFKVTATHIHHIIVNRRRSECFVITIAGALPHSTYTGNTVNKSPTVLRV